MQAALADPGYVRARRELLERHDLNCWAISIHLVGQAVCDPSTNATAQSSRPRSGVTATPRACADARRIGSRTPHGPQPRFGVTTVNGFTGSSIWAQLYSFPPNDFEAIAAGYVDFAERWGPIIDVFDQEGVRFGLEVHPTEIAYDFVTTRRTLEAIDHRPGFGINFDPSHLIPQFLDPAAFLEEFGDRIYHVHVKDSRRTLDGRRSILGSHLNFGERDRGWDFVSPGHGDVDFESILRVLNRIGYQGPLSVEWEDAGMDREWGAADAAGSSASMTSRPPRSSSTKPSRGRSHAGIGVVRTAVGVARQGRRSASACWATPSWARRTSTPTGLALHGRRPAACPASGRRRVGTRRAVAAAARRFGFERWETDWRALIEDDAVGLFDNGGPNAIHAARPSPRQRPASTSSARSRSAARGDEAYEIWRRVEATGVKAMCAFNYRFVPAVGWPVG